MAEKQFVKGLKITKKESKYGNFLKCGIKINTLTQENFITEDGWLNFAIFESKEGKPYAVIDTYGTQQQENTDGNVVQFDDSSEIPF